MTKTENQKLGTLFESALVYAKEKHDGQWRKGSGIPYISHPMQVAGIALEYGADEEQAAAALLHDVIEDTPTTYEDIREAFNERVAEIVRACSDAEDHESKAEWRDRKETYLERLKTKGADVALVSCSDKLHNARSIVADLRTEGPAFFERFTGKRDGTLWYYRSLVEVFGTLEVPAGLLAELDLAVMAMEELA
jgi:(p)ppGpp synthase/HD superfamily hydrolase